MKYGHKTKIAAEVGMHSLVGCRGEFPLGWGNYFWFHKGPRCVNMWAENLEEATKRFLSDGMVEGYLFEDGDRQFFVVCDERIPTNWLYNKFCWTGGYSPSAEVATEMFSIHGDPDGQLEEITDPKSYHAKRGGEYITTADGFSYIKYSVKSEPKVLDTGW